MGPPAAAAAAVGGGSRRQCLFSCRNNGVLSAGILLYMATSRMWLGMWPATVQSLSQSLDLERAMDPNQSVVFRPFKSTLWVWDRFPIYTRAFNCFFRCSGVHMSIYTTCSSIACGTAAFLSGCRPFFFISAQGRLELKRKIDLLGNFPAVNLTDNIALAWAQDFGAGLT
jgi:hypothetical protein